MLMIRGSETENDTEDQNPPRCAELARTSERHGLKSAVQCIGCARASARSTEQIGLRSGIHTQADACSTTGSYRL